MLSENQKFQINMSMNDNWHLVKLTQVWPDGHLINQMAHALLESNAELLSLREQLEAERQRSDTLQTERDEFRRRLKLERSILEDTDKQIAELKALQPVAWRHDTDVVSNRLITVSEVNMQSWIDKGYDVTPLFTAAKPAED
ncbi:hypothetical protein [Yersinia bercovieri]|uniref:hypothetical protein n=1 Tax=Yersinia bercovieri TaxID=634 RepID=UPI0025AA6C67|nr:hypothetical protein [Yersinia bercovieri]MDN0105225.1 hypothetical protein [Yersinia bercovieri]